MKGLRAYLLFFFAGVVSAYGMNAWVDPSGLSVSAAMRTLARRQSVDELLVSETANDQRTWVHTALRERRTCADVLVLGSSTVGRLSSERLSPVTVLNGWLGGPTIEDFEALAATLRDAPCPYPTIVFGIDPWWSANPAVDDLRWMTASDAYARYHASAPWPSRLQERVRIGWARFEERLGFEATRESLRILVQTRGGREDSAGRPRLVRRTPEQFCAGSERVLYVRAHDGHSVSCPAWAYSRERVQAIADGYVRSNTHSMGDWQEVDRARLARLARVVESLSRGRHVLIVTMPYHPTTYARLYEDSRVARHLGDLDATLTRMARGSVELLALRNPRRAGCTGEMFEDSHHAGPECVRRVVERIGPRISR